MKTDIDHLVANLSPDDLWELRTSVYNAILRTNYPEVIVAVNDDADAHEQEVVLACPRCGNGDEGNIQEVDESERWNEVSVPEFATRGGPLGCTDDEAVVTVEVNQGDGSYETVAHMCRSCQMPVALPSWVEVTWC